MSEEAYEIYEDALKEQHSRNQARRIRTRVDQARSSSHSASIRWPFELLQNALDAGPRSSRSVVTVRLSCEPAQIVFEHDGAPFTSQELAALLSGGSSKEYESETTTGRFGTGFLVTHVLAERTRLRGLLQVSTDFERFDLTLDRGGNEDTILDNIRDSNEAIRKALPVSDTAQVPSALFEYAYGEGDSWAHGLNELKRALPYLYATRKALGRVELRDASGHETWEPSKTERKTIADGYLEHRVITVTGSESPQREFCVYRFAAASDESTAALVLVEKTPNGSRVCLPEDNAPRVFREYPLRDSGFVPVNFILDGKFYPDEERSGLLMNPDNRSLLEQAFSAAVVGVQYAIEQKWKDAHRLAYTAPTSRAFDTTSDEEKHWWTDHLAAFAKQLAALPIVDCGSQFLPAVTDEGACADFIIPRLLNISGKDETSVARLWPLAEASDHLLPPREELAPDWTTIAKGWSSLGLEIQLICVAKLAERVRGSAERLEELEVKGDPQGWLADFLDIVGECWRQRSGVELSPLRGLIPNQNEYLRSPKQLKRDQDVSERLKDICESMSYDIRDQLLLSGFEDMARSGELDDLTTTLEEAIPTSITEDEVLRDAVNYISERLPEDKDIDDGTLDIQRGAVRFLAHLWESRKSDGADIARKVPWITSRGRVEQWSTNRLFMGPVRAWPESAQPFADAYPPNRVLHNLYAGSEKEEIPNVVEALADWEIAFNDTITNKPVAELTERRLAALSGIDATGIVVREQRLTQIALLAPDVLNRCQEKIERARALLGLVLCDVARRDQSWKEWRSARGRKSGEDVEIAIRGALWLADIKGRAWVPQPGEDGKLQKVVANSATLKDLLDPAWLQDNDDAIHLLSECFGFDQLELRLIGMVQDEEERQKVRDSLAELVETVGANPDFYTELAADVEEKQKRQRDVERCRNMGLRRPAGDS